MYITVSFQIFLCIPKHEGGRKQDATKLKLKQNEGGISLKKLFLPGEGCVYVDTVTGTAGEYCEWYLISSICGGNCEINWP